MFAPPVLVKCSSEPLRAFRLASTRPDDLLDRYGCADQDRLNLLGNLREIDAKDRLGMGVKLNLKTASPTSPTECDFCDFGGV
jgi:hypothetical protein